MTTSPTRPKLLRALRRTLAICAPFALIWAVALPACRSTGSVPFRAEAELEHKTGGLGHRDRSDLWVSYQIVIDAVDGVPTNYRADQPCVYYKLSLPAGEHTLALRLDYRSPTHHVTTETPTELIIKLAPGEPYRLLDLATDDLARRAFAPHLLPGAPRDEKLMLGGGSR